MLRKSLTRSYFRVWMLLLCIVSTNAFAQTPPSGFASAVVSSNWNEVVGIAFTQSGSEMFVWERPGKVWQVRNGVKTLFLDISQEVGGWHDHGLLGFALHPQFAENGYFYLLYVVDRHHLLNFGTAAYNPGTNTYNNATIGRLTRYTANPNPNGGFSVDLGSRKILIGENKSNGIPIVTLSHGVGSLVFGTDGTLLVSTGDGASPADIDGGGAAVGSYAPTALADGIITTTEDVGAFRSQLINCLNGKILRIDPETGSGIPSNPFYDPSNPNSPASKVWALGLRNPFRFSLKPGTGSHLASDGDPGVLYIGDVGFVYWEEITVCNRPAQNFGWPIFEGLGNAPQYPAKLVQNRDAPNPLYGQAGCTQQFFNFQNLIKQETPSGTSTFPNPCNTSQVIPASIHTFVHTRPLIDWRHNTGPSRTGIFNGSTATEINIGAAGSPVSGPQFAGSAAVGGLFYTGTDFPPEYQNTYFFGDYTGGWIRNLAVNENDRPVAVKDFVNNNAVVVHFAKHPTGEGLYYVNFPSEIRRIYYSSNRPPVAAASVNNSYGASPLTVQFTGSGSTDPEGLPLTYEWNFGDGSALSTSANPSHTFVRNDGTPAKFTVTLKVRDQSGVQDQTTLNISINNTPPSVEITSPLNNTLYPLTGETTYQLRASVNDPEHNASQLTYAWQSTLHHETHQHPEPVDNQPETSMSTSPVGCDGESYFFSIVLTVTDAAGASTTKEVRLYPDCGNIVKVDPIITWANPAPITAGIPLSNVQLNASASYNGSLISGTYNYNPPAGTVLSTGAGQELTVNFVPANQQLYNSVSKTVTIDVNVAPPISFFRAINVNGPALTIDGNNWEASVGAPNYSYTTSNSTFQNQNIPLVPPTDANRSTMIRSSVWGGNTTFTVGAVPAGTYQVSIYVWEDNFPTVFSVSVEGSVVRANHNSGGAGVWSKLGPYQATINDGAVNVSTTGGDAAISGIEIWRVNQGGGNQAPVVSNAIPNQTATAGTAFSYTFPTNTFSDPDPGTNLAYTASLSNGNVLPSWLTFIGTTRNFSGTPAVANVGAIDVRVTASDGVGSINDIFTLTVNPATKLNPVINWSNPAPITVGTPLTSTQLNATATYNAVAVPGAFTYTPPAGTVLGEGTGQQLSVSFVPTDGQVYNSVSKTVSIDINPATGANVFYRAINVNGPALTIDGNNWEASASAANYSYTTSNSTFQNQNIPLVPPTDANRSTMIRSSVWGGNTTFSVGAVPAGTYQIWIYVWEDNFATIFSVSVEGALVLANHNSGGAGVWSKLGPYQATINDGVVNISTTGGDAAISGIEIWGINAGVNQPPVVMNAIPDQNAVIGSQFSYSFPSNTFTDPDPGTLLSYSAALVNGNPLPAWLHFDSNNRNFNGTPPSIGSLDVRVTASDGGTGSVDDDFVLTIGVGNAPVVTNGIPDQSATANSPFSFTFNVNTFTDPDPGTTLVYAASLSDGGALPGWLKFNSTTRNFNGTPATPDLGDVSIRVTATDGASQSVSDVFTLTVGLGNPPVVSNPIPDQTGTASMVFSFTVAANTFTDPDAGTILTYSAALSSGGELPDWLDFNETTRNFTGTPGAADIGPISIRVMASDQAGGSASDIFVLTIGIAPSNTFYRAINVNGPALTIDGHNWEASAGAPNYSYTTSNSTFQNQSIPLIPPTDANRSTMIRSSVWGGSTTFAVGAVPAGSYQVWIYVWEDNFPTVFSVSVEGSLVLANHNSGGAGVWSKLGPYPATINDGAINISTSGGHAAVSGIEIWKVNEGGGNQPPIVANALPNQTATIGTPFTYTFPTNTFSDPDPGTALSYTAGLSNGNALPSWLEFDGTTRNFSGTPAAGDVGVIDVRVTASDGEESVNDVFTLTINSTAAASFYRAININGPALTIDGHNWEASAGAPNYAFTTNRSTFQNQSIPLVPPTDANRSTMIRASVWGGSTTFTVSAVPAGTYQIWIYVWEDNFPTIFSVSVEGSPVLANHNSGGAGVWSKLGPYQATINDSAINISTNGGDAAVSGIEIWTANQGQSSARMAFTDEYQIEPIDEEPSNSNLLVYPNPSSGIVKVEFTTKEAGATQLAIFNTRGEQVLMLFDGLLPANKSEKLELEPVNWVNGFYIVRYTNGKHVKYIKLALAR